MALYGITNGEQAVSSTGPVAGTLNTSGLGGTNYEISLRQRGLAVGQHAVITLEGSANGTFSDVQTLSRWEFFGSTDPEGVTESILWRDLTEFAVGTATASFRFNAVALDTGASMLVLGTLHA